MSFRGNYTRHGGLAAGKSYKQNTQNPQGEQMAAGDLFRLQAVQSMDADIIQNNFYYVVDTDDGGPSNEQPMLDAFDAQVIPSWLPAVTGDLSIDCLSAQKVFPGLKRALIEKFITAVGTAVGQALPLPIAALIQKIDPALSGRGRKGHAFISGISEDNSADGRINGAQSSLLQTLLTSLNVSLTTPGGGIYNPVWATFTKVAPIVIDGFVDWTQGVVLPRLSHIGTRKTPIRKLAP